LVGLYVPPPAPPLQVCSGVFDRHRLAI
jgi:hypothetical protein